MLAPAGAGPGRQGQQRPARGDGPSIIKGLANGHLDRCPVGIPGNGQRAAGGPHGEVGGGPIGLGPTLAEGADGHHHQGGVGFHQLAVVVGCGRQLRRGPRLHQHVGARRQLRQPGSILA